MLKDDFPALPLVLKTFDGLSCKHLRPNFIFIYNVFHFSDTNIYLCSEQSYICIKNSYFAKYITLN